MRLVNRLRLTTSAAVVATVAALAMVQSATAASAAPAPPAPGGDPGSIFVVRAGDQSDEDAIAARAARDSAYRVKAAALVTEWKAAIKDGRSLSLGTVTKDRTPAQTLEVLDSLQGELATGTAPNAKSSATLTPMVSNLNPNTFTVRGTYYGDRSYWINLQTVVAGHYCNAGSCGPDTDRITCSITVNPGAFTSRLDSTCGYFPNAGNFQDKHYDMWAINRGSIVGTNETSNLFSGSGGTGRYYLSSNRGLNSDVLTVAVALWVYAGPEGIYELDDAKTWDATCRPSGDNRCFY